MVLRYARLSPKWIKKSNVSLPLTSYIHQAEYCVYAKQNGKQTLKNGLQLFEKFHFIYVALF